MGGRFRKTKLKNGSSEKTLDAVSPHSLKDRINNMICFDRWTAQTVCLHCVDHLGFCADLVVGDAWLKRYAGDSEGTNIVISRTERGEECLTRMKAFHLEIGSKQDVIESQSIDYALGAIGEGMKKVRKKGSSFSPNTKRAEKRAELLRHGFSLKEVLKIKVVRPLLQTEHFRMAKWVYILLEIRTVLHWIMK
jgi:hypothetical protein